MKGFKDGGIFYHQNSGHVGRNWDPVSRRLMEMVPEGLQDLELLGRKECRPEGTKAYDATGHTVWDRFSDVSLASVHGSLQT